MSSSDTGVPLVLHVVPTAVARGAQREARALADGLQCRSGRRHQVVSLFAGPEQVPVDLSLGHAWHRGEPARGFDPSLARKLRRLLTAEAPAAVVAHGGDALKYVVPATIGGRTPVVYYATGTFEQPDKRTRVLLWRALVARAEVVAAEGDEVLAQCRDLLGVPTARLVLTPNGRDAAVFRPADRHRHGGPQEPPVVLFVGALNAGKGPDRFVDVVAEVRRRGRELRAVVYGDGPMRAELAAGAGATGVEIAGPVDDVAAVMRGADLLVFPSRPTGEGMPGVLIEAGLSGLPVVATTVPGTSNIVVDGVSGFLVPVDDIGSMADAVCGLLDDAERRLRMGAAARRHCVERFDLEAVVQTWEGLLEPLLAWSVTRRGGPDGPGNQHGRGP